MTKKVAIVTGANKGVGLGIVRGLCKRFDGDVYLTARNEELGRKAIEELRKEGLHPLFHQLDITDQASIDRFAHFISTNYDGIDILINNAAVMFRPESAEPMIHQAELTTHVNYFSLVNFCNVMFEIMKNGSRVVNLSSCLGHLSYIPSEHIKHRFSSPDLTVEKLNEMVREFIDDVRSGNYVNEWGKNAYVVSKAAICALSKIQQHKLMARDIKVNSVHPGWVDTDMSAHRGVFTIDRGAEAPLYLALDAPDDLKGQFIWHDSTIVDWVKSPHPKPY